VKVKIRKGDTVEIISGREDDKGKRGEVIRVIPMSIAWWCRVSTSARSTSARFSRAAAR
jgi:hypothetical protein